MVQKPSQIPLPVNRVLNFENNCFESPSKRRRTNSVGSSNTTSSVGNPFANQTFIYSKDGNMGLTPDVRVAFVEPPKEASTPLKAIPPFPPQEAIVVDLDATMVASTTLVDKDPTFLSDSQKSFIDPDGPDARYAVDHHAHFVKVFLIHPEYLRARYWRILDPEIRDDILKHGADRRFLAAILAICKQEERDRIWSSLSPEQKTKTIPFTDEKTRHALKIITELPPFKISEQVSYEPIPWVSEKPDPPIITVSSAPNPPPSRRSPLIVTPLDQRTVPNKDTGNRTAPMATTRSDQRTDTERTTETHSATSSSRKLTSSSSSFSPLPTQPGTLPSSHTSLSVPLAPPSGFTSSSTSSAPAISGSTSASLPPRAGVTSSSAPSGTRPTPRRRQANPEIVVLAITPNHEKFKSRSDRFKEVARISPTTELVNITQMPNGNFFIVCKNKQSATALAASPNWGVDAFDTAKMGRLKSPTANSQVVAADLFPDMAPNDFDAKIKTIYPDILKTSPLLNSEKSRRVGFLVEFKTTENATKAKNEGLKLDNAIIRCRAYYPPSAIRCYKCQQYGHTSSNCTNSTICGFCSSGHKSSDCPHKNSAEHLKCLCGKNHRAGSFDCALFKAASTEQRKIGKSYSSAVSASLPPTLTPSIPSTFTPVIPPDFVEKVFLATVSSALTFHYCDSKQSTQDVITGLIFSFNEITGLTISSPDSVTEALCNLAVRLRDEKLLRKNMLSTTENPPSSSSNSTQPSASSSSSSDSAQPSETTSSSTAP